MCGRLTPVSALAAEAFRWSSAGKGAGTVAPRGISLKTAGGFREGVSRLEFELGASFGGASRLAWVATLGEAVPGSLGAFRGANLQPGRNPLDRQRRLVPQPARDRQLAGVGAPARR